jgi:hypothetical protein
VLELAERGDTFGGEFVIAESLGHEVLALRIEADEHQSKVAVVSSLEKCKRVFGYWCGASLASSRATRSRIEV